MEAGDEWAQPCICLVRRDPSMVKDAFFRNRSGNVDEYIMYGNGVVHGSSLDLNCSFGALCLAVYSYRAHRPCQNVKHSLLATAEILN